MSSSFIPATLEKDDETYLVYISQEDIPNTSLSSTSRDNSESAAERSLILVWELSIQPLTDVERITLFAITIAIATIAVLGNILVLYVNISRKQRFLFRTCLISLAVSDLIFVAVTTCIYLTKFSTKNSLLWFLGPAVCSLFPFLQTMVVLVNSIMLVCIALDRYMAIVRIVKGSWEPSKLFCLACCTIIWGFSAAVSSPLLAIYEYYRVYVLPFPVNEGDELTYYVGHLCGSNKDENGYYFAIISTFIFGPLFITFIWLNSVLAKEVWKRRIDMTVSVIESENPSNGTCTGLYSSEATTRRNERRQRQVRMFKVILALMAVFFICRMPNWVFLLYKLGHDSSDSIHFLLYYIFGLMVMANCMLNPFLYTFLSETIRLTTFLFGIICGIFTAAFNLLTCKMCRRTTKTSTDNYVNEKQQYFDTM